MRLLVAVAAALLAPTAFAQAISGTLTATFEGFNQYEVPAVRLTLNLTCALTCDASAPEKSFKVNGGTSAWFASAPTENTGYVGSGFGSDPTGLNSYVSEAFEAGTAFIVRAKSATCQCGNRTGEGGYVDLESTIVAIPPTLTASAMRAGTEEAVVVAAQPQGSEKVEVKLLGAGLDQTLTLLPADFGTNKAAFARFTPTAAGTLTITTTLQPFGASRSETVEVTAGSGSGGGTGSTGGGSGGGGGDEPEPGPFGCSTGALAPALGLALALLRRRR